MFVGLLPAWQATRRASLTDDLGDGKGALERIAQAVDAATADRRAGGARDDRAGGRGPARAQRHQSAAGADRLRHARRADARGSRCRRRSTARRNAVARSLSARCSSAWQASPGVRFAALDSQAPLVTRRRLERADRRRPADDGGDRIISRLAFRVAGLLQVLEHPAARPAAPSRTPTCARRRS